MSPVSFSISLTSTSRLPVRCFSSETSYPVVGTTVERYESNNETRAFRSFSPRFRIEKFRARPSKRRLARVNHRDKLCRVKIFLYLSNPTNTPVKRHPHTKRLIAANLLPSRFAYFPGVFFGAAGISVNNCTVDSWCRYHGPRPLWFGPIYIHARTLSLCTPPPLPPISLSLSVKHQWFFASSK